MPDTNRVRGPGVRAAGVLIWADDCQAHHCSAGSYVEEFVAHLFVVDDEDDVVVLEAFHPVDVLAQDGHGVAVFPGDHAVLLAQPVADRAGEGAHEHVDGGVVASFEDLVDGVTDGVDGLVDCVVDIGDGDVADVFTFGADVGSVAAVESLFQHRGDVHGVATVVGEFAEGEAVVGWGSGSRGRRCLATGRPPSAAARPA